MMIRCPKCGIENDLGHNFCSECGAKLPAPEGDGGSMSIGDKNVVSGDVVGGSLNRQAYNNGGDVVAVDQARPASHDEAIPKDTPNGTLSIGDMNVFGGDVVGGNLNRQAYNNAGDVVALDQERPASHDEAIPKDTSNVTSSIGDRNVFGGDVVGGNLDRRAYNNAGDVVDKQFKIQNAVINQDESRKMATCSLCGHRLVVSDSIECPKCHRTICENCRDAATGLCSACARRVTEEKEAAYRKRLAEVIQNGVISLAARMELDKLRKTLGLEKARAKELENEYCRKVTADILVDSEIYSLKQAYACLYHERDAGLAEGLLLPLYNSHNALQNAVIYAPLFEAISYRDEAYAKEQIEEKLKQADVPELLYLLFDIAIRHDDLVQAEKTLHKLMVLEDGRVLLACRRIVLLLAIMKKTHDRGKLEKAEKLVSSLPDESLPCNADDWQAGIRAKMEASWVFRARKLFWMAKGEDSQIPSREFCEQNNLFYALVADPEQIAKFTLLIGDYAVYVTAENEVKFGRDPRKNDFAVLDWKNNKTPAEFPTGGVSREQLRIRNCDDNSVLLFTEKDTTLLDGISPSVGGNGGIPLRPQSQLSMGPISFTMNIQYCKMRMNTPMCINCMAKKVQSVTLSREDGLPEGFALVWQCCDLMLLDNALKGYRLYRRNGGFLLETPSGNLFSLVCGMKCMDGSTPIRVLDFEQRLIARIPF